MQPKRFLPKILLVVGFTALFFLLKYQGQAKKLVQFNIEKGRIYSDNFFQEAGSVPKRLMPFVTKDMESELKLSVQAPFADFTESDWKGFWNIIYGAFPKDAPKEPGLPQRLRQLTQDEIPEELLKRYPERFSDFKEEDWGNLFSIIFRK